MAPVRHDASASALCRRSAGAAARLTRTAAMCAAAVLLAACGTTTSPRISFTGVWLAQLPEGGSIEIDATQVGATVTGTVDNVGPLSMQPQPLKGSVTTEGVTLGFKYPARGAGPNPGPLIGWSFHGVFASPTTVSGTISASTGGATTLLITKATGPLPL